MAGVNSLRNGYIWRVGNGQKIDIWENAWIPNCASRKINTPRRRHLLTKVSDLIDPIMNCWDEDLVRQTLCPIDAQRVLVIPLPMHDMSDFIVWSYTKNGLFTVRSAYSEEWNQQHGRKLQYTNGMGRTNANPIWGKIWKLSCLTKVKNSSSLHCMELSHVVLRSLIDTWKFRPSTHHAQMGQKTQNTSCFCVRRRKRFGTS